MCKHCDKPSEPNRMYCSNACKQKAYRERKKIERQNKENTWSMFDIEHTSMLYSAMLTMSREEFIETVKFSAHLDGVPKARNAVMTMGVLIGEFEGGIST